MDMDMEQHPGPSSVRVPHPLLTEIEAKSTPQEKNIVQEQHGERVRGQGQSRGRHLGTQRPGTNSNVSHFLHTYSSIYMNKRAATFYYNTSSRAAHHGHSVHLQ